MTVYLRNTQLPCSIMSSPYGLTAIICNSTRAPDVQRRHLHGGPRRRIGRKELAVHGVEFREVIEARDVGGHRRDVLEIHAGRLQDLAHVGERLPRLGFDAAAHEPAGDRIASKMARDVQRVAGQDARAEGQPGRSEPSRDESLGVDRSIARQALAPAMRAS